MSCHLSLLIIDCLPALYSMLSLILAPLGSRNRQEQLVCLLTRKIKTIENDQTLAGKFRQGTDKAVRILMVMKDYVSSAVSAEPHAALAWVGVCSLLPVLLPH